uniref:Uncharacterized protein n=1 Tax=Globodera pallida TaxID=36090 RepID=A0A183BNB8_GLOPA
MVENRAQETFISCNCTFGEKDKDWNNDELVCKRGQFDAKGNGRTYTQLCKKGSTYCFAAKCAKEGRHYDTWGCTNVKNCSVISKEFKAHCNCSFGEWMVELGNQNLIIPSFLNTTDSAKNWRTGKDLNEKETQDVPLQISPEGRIVIHAKSIHKIADEGGVVPDVIKLYFNGSTNDESRKMILNICVPNVAGSREKCKDGLILCFVGQMDPANAPVITQFQLKNYFENNEIATKCKNAQAAQANWTEFEGKKLHGFQIAHVGDKLMLSSSTSLETVTCTVEDEPCCAIQLGEPGILGGFVAGQPLNESETFVDKAWRGGLLRQENPVSALAFDFLGYIPQGGGLGIIADKCDMQITLEGDGLLKCLGKKCKDSNPEKNSAKTLAPVKATKKE